MVEGIFWKILEYFFFSHSRNNNQIIDEVKFIRCINRSEANRIFL